MVDTRIVDALIACSTRKQFLRGHDLESFGMWFMSQPCHFPEVHLWRLTDFSSLVSPSNKYLMRFFNVFVGFSVKNRKDNA